MTSDKVEISEEARRLLADQYLEKGYHWFASDILKGKSKQFDPSLIVISTLLRNR